jgi:hypothetical protein
MADNKERSAFIASLKKDASMLKKAASKKVSSGFMDEEELIETLGLSDVKQNYRMRLTRVSYGIDKNKNKYFSFNYVIIDGPHRGTPVGLDYFGIPSDNKEQAEKRYERIMSTFQRLGVDTTKWKADQIPENCVKVADLLTDEGTGVLGSLYTYDGNNGPRAGMNILSIFPVDETTPSKGKGKPADDEESEEEEVEEVEEEEESDEVADPEDGSSWEDWVGYAATLEVDDETIDVETTAYEDGIFTCVSPDGTEYQCSPSDLTF